MATTYSFSLSSHADTAPEPNLENGWYALFNPVTAETFKSLNTQLDQQQGWFTVSTATNGSTGSFHDVKASFNNFGGWPMSMQINIDCLPGPGTDPEQGYLYFGPSRNSTLVFGSSAGFIKGTYPASFAFNASGAAPYAIGITTGIQTYTKSDPNFSVPYGIYNCSGTWSTEDFISVCSVDATYSYSYNNTGTIALASTEQQTLAAYTNVGYCAANDGKGTVATFTDVSGTITITTHTEASDAANATYWRSRLHGNRGDAELHRLAKGDFRE
jgi:hypothetical protein